MKYLLVIFGFIILSILQACTGQDTDTHTNTAVSQEAGSIPDGEALFVMHCKQCHLPKKDFIGPSLAGVEARWENRKDLYAFVKNSQEVIIRNKYAKDLFEKWNNSPMLPFPNLSNSEIDAILQYCNQADE